MSEYEINTSRRKFLSAVTTVIGGVGAGFAVVPFVGSWLPSAQAKALGAPIDIDVTQIEVGQKVTVAWRGKPIIVVHRNEDTVSKLSSLDQKLRDPKSAESNQPLYTTNGFRSIKPEFLVLEGICTHLGCVPIQATLFTTFEIGLPHEMVRRLARALIMKFASDAASAIMRHHARQTSLTSPGPQG